MQSPPSLNRPNPKVPTLPDSVTHVYVRQHNTKGLAPRYVGPFPVTNRPSRSTIEIKIGLTKAGADRIELRHISDVKIAYLREDAVVAERAKRGRPPKAAPPPDTSLPDLSLETTPPDTSVTTSKT